MIAPRNGEGFTAVIGGGGAMAIGISAGSSMYLIAWAVTMSTARV